MGTKIKKWFGLEKETEYVNNYFDFSNMRAGVVMSSVIIVLELWMITSLFVNLAEGARVRSLSWIVGHILSYFVLLAVAVIMLLHSIKCIRNNRNPHRRTMLLSWSFAFTSIAFGIYISYHDYLRGEQIFTFLTMLVFAICLLVWRPVTTLILSTMSFLAMYYIMVLIDGASYATQVNFFIMWICITMSAIANYYQRINEARKDERLEDANKYLRYLSLTDPLTGMKNRNGLNEEMQQFYGRDMIVLMTDVDSFKYINDTYGHDVGDDVLRKMADHLKQDFLLKQGPDQENPIHGYRFGGDEFLLFADGGIRDDFLFRVKKWQEELFHISFQDTGIRVLCSCGYVYGRPENVADIQDMIRFADQKLYEAKRLGRMQMVGDAADVVAGQDKKRVSKKRLMTEREIDPMTGLPNMIYFREHADKLIQDQMESENMIFLYFDIENFKAYNERYSFQSGDMLLKNFAQKLDEVFAGGLAARVSDDHFVVLSYKEGWKESVAALRKMVRGVQHDVQLELKTGIYIAAKDECNASLACDRARIACNSVKKHFDQEYRIYDQELEDQFRLRQYVVNHIDAAIANEYIKVFYQPIVWLATGKICGLEALARWDDPEYGLLPPSAFIDVLEEYRQIHKLDRCVIRQVCKDLDLARKAGEPMIPVSLNFSRLDFELCDMVTILEETAQEYQIEHRLLDVEVTESALTDRPEFLDRALTRLHKDGFRLWLDDFGSGYSSLNVLKDYDFDVLKIDMKFLSDFASNERSKPILNNVVRLATEISMCPLTEGVETDEQIFFLNSIGCERAQGYYYGKPMEKGKLKECIDSGKLQISEELVS